MSTDEKLLVWKAITGHVIAIMLITGLFGIIFLAVGGIVKISDPTTATFIGTATGYIVGQLARPLAYYFNVPRIDLEKNGEKGNKIN